jgi:hypothetical protein
MASANHDDVVTVSASSFWDHGILKIGKAPTLAPHASGETCRHRGGFQEPSSRSLVAPGDSLSLYSLRLYFGRTQIAGAVAPILTLPFPDKMPIPQLRLDSSAAILGHTCSGRSRAAEFGTGNRPGSPWTI